MRIIETDNFGGDYPDEKFLNLPSMDDRSAQRVADAINEALCHYDNAPRFWKVVPNDYEPQPGFQP